MCLLHAIFSDVVVDSTVCSVCPAERAKQLLKNSATIARSVDIELCVPPSFQSRALSIILLFGTVSH